MCTVWEEKLMHKIFSILRYEYKMQVCRIATWGAFLVATVVALLDNFPSVGNLARLEFLEQPAYFIFRTMSLDGLIMIFSLMFLLSGRFPVDRKTGVKPLFMAAPISKGQYVSGKLSGGFLYTLTMITVFLVLNTAVYAAFNPIEANVMEYIMPLVKTLIISGIPVSFFISFCSVALPALLDIRLFYFVISVMFILNAGSVSSAEKRPFYLITSGDLIKPIWKHPKFPFYDTGSVIANLCFLLGCGLLSAFLLMLKRKFWRTEE